jgi:hypothetical protein
MDIEGSPPSLNAWAARHGMAASGRCAELGNAAVVLWHGTTRERADHILEHGLFHKRGLWAARHPAISHSFCRNRSARFETEGAIVSFVVDEETAGAEAEWENENVVRFHHGLPPEVVQYVLVHDQARFVGGEPAHEPRPWPGDRFKRRGADWVSVRQPPVRYSDAESYSSASELARLCLRRLLDECREIGALEAFSCIYAAVEPWKALEHGDILTLLDDVCEPCRQRGRLKTFKRREARDA